MSPIVGCITLHKLRSKKTLNQPKVNVKLLVSVAVGRTLSSFLYSACRNSINRVLTQDVTLTHSAQLKYFAWKPEPDFRYVFKE